MLNKLNNEIVNKPKLIELFAKFYNLNENQRNTMANRISKTEILLFPLRVECYKVKKEIEKIPALKDISDKEFINIIEFFISQSRFKQKHLPYPPKVENKLRSIFNNIDIKLIKEELNDKKEQQLNELAHGFYKELSQPNSSRYHIRTKDVNLFDKLKTLLKTKKYIDEWNDDIFLEYALDTFNQLFNTKHITWTNLKKDKKYDQIRIKFKDKQSTFNNQNKSVDLLVNHIALFEQLNQYYNFNEKPLLDQFSEDFAGTNTDAMVELNIPTRFLSQLTENLSIRTIIHEFNHIVQIHKNNGVRYSGFNTSEEKYKNGKMQYEFFNETVTEFMTEEIMKDCQEEVKNLNYPLQDRNRTTTYTTACRLLNNFLTTYKEELKSALVSGDPMKFRDKLGAENFDRLAEYTHFYLSSNENEYLSKLSNLLGYKIKSFDDVIKSKDKIDKLGLKFNSNLTKYVDAVINSHYLCNRLVKHKEDFNNGTMVNCCENLAQITD